MLLPKRVRRSVAGMALFLVLASAADAATVTAVFKGRIRDIVDLNGSFDTSVTVGTDYTAVLNMSADTPDDYSGVPNIGEYIDRSATNGLRVTFGDYSITTDPTSQHQEVSIYENTQPNSSLVLVQGLTGSGNGLIGSYARAFLFGGPNLLEKGLPPTGPGIANTGLWDPDQSTFSFFTFSSSVKGSATYDATIDSAIFSTAVPEPSSIALMFGMGITGAGFLLRRRKE